MKNYIIKLAQELIQIPAENPPGDCSDIAERILKELASIGITDIKTYEYEKGMPNFIIQTGDGNDDAGHFVIGGHMDTVPVHPDEIESWEVPPFSGKISWRRNLGKRSCRHERCPCINYWRP